MTSRDFYRKLLIAAVIVVVVLFSSFIAMMLLDRKAIQLETVYPRIDCNYLYTIYNDTQIKNNAGIEFY